MNTIGQDLRAVREVRSRIEFQNQTRSDLALHYKHQRDALKAEVNEAWQAAQDAGLRADRNSDYVAKLHTERDALRAALEKIAKAGFVNNAASDVARQTLKELEEK